MRENKSPTAKILPFLTVCADWADENEVDMIFVRDFIDADTPDWSAIVRLRDAKGPYQVALTAHEFRQKTIRGERETYPQTAKRILDSLLITARQKRAVAGDGGSVFNKIRLVA